MKLAALALLVSACVRPPAPVFGERPPTGCERAVEPRCASWYAERILAESWRPEVRDPALVHYMALVADRLVRAGGLGPAPLVHVLDDNDAQAEAWVSGTIYVYRGALERLRSEAEIAALIGHELGHLAAHHEDVPPTSHRARLDDEIEADAIAVHLVAAAGYAPGAVETMLRAISAGNPVACADAPAADHPCTGERVARARALAVGLPTGELGIERYRAATADLVVGDDPQRAATVGGALVFARAGLALAPGGGTVAAADGHGIVVQGETIATVAVVSRAFGLLLRSHPPAGQAFIVGDHAALWIMVISGADHPAHAAALARAVRRPRAGELAGLHTTRFDPAAPRALWPRS
ncbi:MAG: M48 family metalloprotease [Kofleriaceae bacterium]